MQPEQLTGKLTAKRPRRKAGGVILLACALACALACLCGPRPAHADFTPGTRVPTGTASTPVLLWSSTANGGLGAWTVTGAYTVFGAQAAGAVLAGPTTGTAAAPTFRALVNGDLPVAVSLSGLNVLLVPPPTAITITPMGTAGTTPYRYNVSAVVGIGETTGGIYTFMTTGNAILSATNYNHITWGTVSGATGYKVYGRTASDNFIYMATVPANAAFYDDTGTATPSGAASPIVNTTGYVAAAVFGTPGQSPSSYAVVAAGKISGSRFDMGSDLSLIPITAGNSSIVTYHALQLLGNYQSIPNSVTPGTYAGTDAAHVIIGCTQAAKPGLLILLASGQTGDALQVNSSTSTGLFRIDKTGTPTLVNGVLPYTGTIPLTATGLHVTGGAIMGYYTGGTTSAPAAPLVGN